jgi:hypothetical protein
MVKKILLLTIPILILAIICGIYFHHENTTLQTSYYEVSSKKLTNDFDGYKIMQISDFHNTRSKKIINSIIDKIKEEKPNIIVLTGDIIDPKQSHTEASIDFVKKIKDYAPIYYITGNHESYFEDGGYEKEKEALIDNGVIVLDNKVECIEINDSKINLLGIDDPKMVEDSDLSEKEIMRNEVNSIDYDKDNFTILLSHRPEKFKLDVELKMDLVFTGHAHGGQIRIPFIGGLYAPNQGIFPKYTNGEFKKDNTTMIVSRGIGGSFFPFRINNRPNLVIATLKSGGE